MKYVVCVPDGCADEPIDALGGRTPLEVASMPVLARLAKRAEVGRAAVIPPGLPPGSDVGNMSILGYDPAAFHTGRAPIEAAALGLRLRPDQVAYRCNLVTIGGDGTMLDFAGGHPSTDDAAEVIAALDTELGGGTSSSRRRPGPTPRVRRRTICPTRPWCGRPARPRRWCRR
jgi:2,3-bisphosphoglycerate-independent phosphoglycerate mutase